MPLLLNVLRNADGAEYSKLRTKAMECAGLIAIAVGKEVFRPDSGTLVELLIRIQSEPGFDSLAVASLANCRSLVEMPQDPSDTQLTYYLMSTWAKICQAMDVEFEPYLPVVMPPLLTTAGAKPEFSVYGG